jgi:hypothetical protein
MNKVTPFLMCAALLASIAAGCSRAPAHPAPAVADGATLRGVYENGAGRSVFLPCGSNEQWYVATESAAGRELQRLIRTQDMQSPGGGMVPVASVPTIRRAYAEVQGDTVAVRPSRAALGYAHELRLTKVLVVQPAQGASCP